MKKAKDKKPLRGRRPIGPQITIRIPQELIDAIRATGEARASFIRAAIEAELRRRGGPTRA